MTGQSIDDLAAVVRAGLDRLERLARDADTYHPWTVEDGHYGPRVHVHEDPDEVWSRDGQGVTAAYRCDDPYDECASARASYRAEAQLILECAEPAAVLRDVASKRALLDEALGWAHASDCWTLTPNPGSCDCGRDARVHSVLTYLAKAYQEAT